MCVFFRCIAVVRRYSYHVSCQQVTRLLQGAGNNILFSETRLILALYHNEDNVSCFPQTRSFDNCTVLW